jgi:pantetheine-phosphate adenylyltransferase
MKIAIYPDIFDPITLSQIDVALRAAGLFDLLVVAPLETDAALFSTEERLKMINDALASRPNIKILSFRGLVGDFARYIEATAIIYELKLNEGSEHRLQLAQVIDLSGNRIEMCGIIPAPEYSFISNRLIKEIAQAGGDVSKFVPSAVAHRLREVFSVTSQTS